MSLLSTVLAFVLVPLVKRNPDEDKEKIAYLEAELASYKEGNKVLAAHLAAAERDVSILQTRLNGEQERGVLDREQTRYWRAQADYWQQAYTSLTVPNQFSPNQQITPPQYHQVQGQGQQLSAQQLGQQALSQLGHWLDCTCVPGRSEALMRGATAAEARLRPGTPD